MINKQMNFNLSNGQVASINIKSIDETNAIITADCLDSNGAVLAENQWFVYDGENKTVPFELTDMDIEILKNNKISLNNNEIIVEENN